MVTSVSIEVSRSFGEVAVAFETDIFFCFGSSLAGDSLEVDGLVCVAGLICRLRLVFKSGLACRFDGLVSDADKCVVSIFKKSIGSSVFAGLTVHAGDAGLQACADRVHSF